MLKSSFYQHNFNDLKELLISNALNPASASLLYKHHYKEKNTSKCEHHNLSKKAREFVSENFDFTLPEIELIHESEDQTVKFLVKLADGQNQCLSRSKVNIQFVCRLRSVAP